MKPFLFIVCCIALALPGRTQEVLTLADCLRQAGTQNPLSAMPGLRSRSGQVRDHQLQRQYWPKFEVQGQGTWQNEVTRVDIPISIPGFDIPKAPQDQYRLIGEVTQTLYDGGTTRHLRDAARSEAEAMTRQAESDLVDVRLRAHQLYFGLLLVRAQGEVTRLVVDQLNRQKTRLDTLFAGGIAQRADVDRLAIEVLRQTQRLDEGRNQEAMLRDQLGRLLGRELPEDLVLQVPEARDVPAAERPELAMFSARDQALEANRDVVLANRLPKLQAFAQGGMGRPGYNLFDPDPAPMFLAGARLKWNLGAFWLDGPDRENIEVQQAMNRQQEQAFRQGIDLQRIQGHSRADYYRSVSASDQEILRRQERIRDIATIQLEEGILTATDYLREVDAWSQARIQTETHHIQAIQAETEVRLVAWTQTKPVR